MLVVIILAIVIVAILIFNHEGSNMAASKNGKLQVVAAENFWGNIASQIGGDHVTVTSIISDPNTDPHLYESDAQAAAAISTASIVLKNGLGYDDFIDKLLTVSPNNQREVLSIDKLLSITGDNPNPHLWYDVLRIPEVATSIEHAFAEKDPANSSAYATNLASFKTSLQPVIDTINHIKTKYTNTPVGYTERVPGYLLDAAGLDVKTPAGFASAIEEGNDPSPNDAATMNTLMTNHSVRVLLYNAQVTSSVTQHVQNLARQAGIPIVGVTETLPANEPTYQSWQLDQAKALLTALGG